MRNQRTLILIVIVLAGVILGVLGWLAARPYTQLSVGWFHSCVRRADGLIGCWGRNDHKQLDAPEFSFAQVSAGGDFTCGIRAEGALLCWGMSLEGQTTPPSGAFTQLSAGWRHACALRRDGTVACWGRNREGQVTGQASVTPALPVYPAPNDARAGKHTQVAAGGAHTCALRADGRVECWGWKRDNVSSPPNALFSQISAGRAHTCGVRQDGALMCWGDNTFGKAAPPDGMFSQVSAGDDHSCAVRVTGDVVCWGNNNFGQSQVREERAAMVGAGGNHTCAMTVDGNITCWGLNDVGQAPTPDLLPAELPRGHHGVVYYQALEVRTRNLVPRSIVASPFSNFPYLPRAPQFTVEAGLLPAGLRVSAHGVLSGVPVDAGKYTFTIRAVDANSFLTRNTFVLQID